MPDEHKFRFIQSAFDAGYAENVASYPYLHAWVRAAIVLQMDRVLDRTSEIYTDSPHAYSFWLGFYFAHNNLQSE